VLYLAYLSPKELARIRKEDAKRLKAMKKEREQFAKIVAKEKMMEMERLKAAQRNFGEEDTLKLAKLKEEREVLARLTEERKKEEEMLRKEREEEERKLRRELDPAKLKAKKEAEIAQRKKALEKLEAEKKKQLLRQIEIEKLAGAEKRDVKKEREERLMQLKIQQEITRAEQERLAREEAEKRRKQEKEDKKLSANVIEARRIKSVLDDAKRVVETVKQDLADVKREIDAEKAKLKKIKDKRERDKKLRELMITRKNAENRLKLAYKIYADTKIKKVIDKKLLTQLGVRPDVKVLSADFWRRVEAKERVRLTKDRTWALESVSRTFRQLEDLSRQADKKVDITKDGALHFWGDKEKKETPHEGTKKITGKISEEDLAIGGIKLKRREEIEKGIDQTNIVLSEVDRAVDDTLRQIDRSRTLATLEAEIARKEREEMIAKVKSTDLQYGVKDVDKYLAAKKMREAKKEAEKGRDIEGREKPKSQAMQAARRPEYKRIDVRGKKEEKPTGSIGHFALERKPAKVDESFLRRMFGQPIAAKKGPPGQQAKLEYRSTEFDFAQKKSPLSKKALQTMRDQYKYSSTEFDVSKMPPVERERMRAASQFLAAGKLTKETTGGALVKKFAKKGIIPMDHTISDTPRGLSTRMGVYQKTSVNVLGWINKTALLSTIIGIFFAISGLVLYIVDELISRSIYMLGVGSMFLCFGISTMIYSTNKSNWLMKTGFLAVIVGISFTCGAISFYLFQRFLFIVFLYLGVVGAIFIVIGICIESFGSKITIRLASGD
jgi:hypothetical protein